MTDGEPLRSGLYDRHVARGAKMVCEEGWEVPLSYRGVLEEVEETRRRASLFDVSPLGRLRIRGDGALDLLERLCTADVAHQEDDTAGYTLLCNEAGGILADAWLIRTNRFWLLTTGAATREKVLRHVQDHAADFDVKVDDQTLGTAHLLVAGPRAAARLDAVLPIRPSALPRRAARVGSLMIARYVALRVGWCNTW